MPQSANNTQFSFLLTIRSSSTKRYFYTTLLFQLKWIRNAIPNKIMINFSRAAAPPLCVLVSSFIQRQHGPVIRISYIRNPYSEAHVRQTLCAVLCMCRCMNWTCYYFICLVRAVCCRCCQCVVARLLAFQNVCGYTCNCIDMWYFDTQRHFLSSYSFHSHSRLWFLFHIRFVDVRLCMCVCISSFTFCFSFFFFFVFFISRQNRTRIDIYRI